MFLHTQFKHLRRALLIGVSSAALASALPAVASDTTGPDALWASTLPDANGHRMNLAGLKGQTLVVNFWASWCGPCVEEMPALSALQAQYASKGIKFVGIGVDSAANINGFLKKVAVSYPIYVAGFGGADLARAFGNTAGGLPFTVVIDRNGRVRYSKLGRVDIAELKQALTTP
jgi:thiol-disulfide isomerase/thioredoxin